MAENGNFSGFFEIRPTDGSLRKGWQDAHVFSYFEFVDPKRQYFLRHGLCGSDPGRCFCSSSNPSVFCRAAAAIPTVFVATADTATDSATAPTGQIAPNRTNVWSRHATEQSGIQRIAGCDLILSPTTPSTGCVPVAGAQPFVAKGHTGRATPKGGLVDGIPSESDRKSVV